MPSTVALFYLNGHLAQALEALRATLINEVEAAPEDHVLEADEAEWARAPAERHRIEAPLLKPDEVTMEKPRAVQNDISRDASRIVRTAPAYARGYRTAVHIPFSGGKGVFDFLPSSHIVVELHAVVLDGELVHYVQYPEDRPVDITAHSNQFIRRVEQNLASARGDISRFNSSLERDALAAIEDRRRRIERHRTHIAATGFPIVAARDPSNTIVVKRRPAPLLRLARPGQPMELESVLENEVYEHILHVIRQHSPSMERNPNAYAGMGEEARRYVIVDTLHTHYPSAGNAETLNYSGQTDIRLNHEASAYSSPSASSGVARRSSQTRSTSCSGITRGGTRSSPS